MISAGFTGSGGYPSVLRLAASAKDIGLRSVAVVDGDPTQDAKDFLEANKGLANAVVRLPERAAIEVAILHNLTDDVIRQALRDAAYSAGLTTPTNVDELSDGQLNKEAISFIKRNSLHAQFVEALAPENLPPLAIQVLTEAVHAATGQSAGVIQL